MYAQRSFEREAHYSLANDHDEVRLEAYREACMVHRDQCLTGISFCTIRLSQRMEMPQSVNGIPGWRREHSNKIPEGAR